MTKSIRSVAYISTSKLSVSDEALTDEVNKIIEISKKNNADQGITGALLYNGGYFIQVLEGPDEAINKTLERIKQDSRHDSIRILSDHTFEKRRFSKWDMALAGFQDEFMPDLKVHFDSVEDLQVPDSGKAALKVMTDLLDRFEIKLD